MSAPRPAPADRFVTAEGLRVRCVTAGEGRPVVLLHGWPTSSFLWRGVIPGLAARGRVIALDLPGFGRSDRLRDGAYTLDFQARCLEAVLQQLDAPEVALVLHDLGGPVGLLWAVRHPERVARLVVLNTLLFPDARAARLFMASGSFAARARAILGVARVPLHLKATMLAAHTPGLRALLFGRLGVALVLRLGTSRRLGPGIAAAHASAYASRDGRRALARTLLDPRREELEEIVRNLHRLRAPALVAYGPRDRLLPGVKAEMHRLAAELAGARLATVPAAGHFVQEDEPETLGRLLDEFLGDWLRS